VTAVREPERPTATVKTERGTYSAELKPDRTVTIWLDRFSCVARGHRGANLKYLAEYCGASVAMLEHRYGRFLKGNSDE